MSPCTRAGMNSTSLCTWTLPHINLSSTPLDLYGSSWKLRMPSILWHDKYLCGKQWNHAGVTGFSRFYTNLWSPSQLQCVLSLKQKGDISNTKILWNSWIFYRLPCLLIIKMMLSFGTNAKFEEYSQTFFELPRVAQTPKKGKKISINYLRPWLQKYLPVW